MLRTIDMALFVTWQLIERIALQVVLFSDVWLPIKVVQVVWAIARLLGFAVEDGRLYHWGLSVLAKADYRGREIVQNILAGRDRALDEYGKHKDPKIGELTECGRYEKAVKVLQDKGVL